jgi:hypothetical protein
MGAACDIAHSKVSMGVWSKVQADTFFHTCGVIPAYADMVVKAAMNSLEMDGLDAGSEEHADLIRRSLLPAKESLCFPVTQPEKPLTWQHPGVSLLEHIDVLMHLVFLGIVATVLRLHYFKWLKAHGMMKSLAQVTQRPVQDLQKMNIAWCKVQPILASGTLGNSVSETFLAFARCGKYLFGCSAILKPNDAVCSDPNLPPESYNITQIRSWYSAREIRFDVTPNGPDIRAMFMAAMEAPGGPPPIPEKGERGVPRAVVDHLVESMTCLAAHVMVEGEIDEEDCLSVDRHVKMFLSSYEAFDEPKRRKKAEQAARRGIRPGKNQAGWISHMNYISLLNLADVMRRYGSLRALWEGDRKGEGGLPKIKAKIHSGTKGDWSGSAARAVLLDDALERTVKAAADAATESPAIDQTVQQLIDSSRLITGEAAENKYKNFLCYKNEDEAAEALLSGKPVSLVVLECGMFGMMLQKSLQFIPVRRAYEVDPVVICGAAYLGFVSQPAIALVVGEAERQSTILKQQQSLPKKFVLLLPELKKEADDPFSGRHYFITSNWEEMDLAGNIVRYRVSRAVC